MAVTTPRYRDPSWWNAEYDSGWDRVKAAFRRDWDQTKHDFGGDKPNLKQNVDDTVGQAAGRRPIPPGAQPNFDADEPAYRFGYGARQHYGARYPQWNTQLEDQLRQDWGTAADDDDEDWDYYRDSIRRGWDYNPQL